jgi:hypothetical protein
VEEVMAKQKSIEPGDVVYHLTESEKLPGIVTATKLVEVDWGPEHATSVHREEALTTVFIPDYGSKE